MRMLTWKSFCTMTPIGESNRAITEKKEVNIVKLMRREPRVMRYIYMEKGYAGISVKNFLNRAKQLAATQSFQPRDAENAVENFIFGIAKICGIENAIPQISPSQTQSRNGDLRNCRSVQGKRLNKRALYMSSTALFGIIHRSHYTISINFYFYLQYFQ